MRILRALVAVLVVLPAAAEEPPHVTTQVVCRDSLVSQRPLLLRLARAYASILDPHPIDPVCIASFPQAPPAVPPGSKTLLVIDLSPKEPAGAHPIVFQGKAFLVTASGEQTSLNIFVRHGKFSSGASDAAPDQSLLDGGIGTAAWRLGLLSQDRPRQAFPVGSSSAVWGELLVPPSGP